VAKAGASFGPIAKGIRDPQFPIDTNTINYHSTELCHFGDEAMIAIVPTHGVR
jgi:hypothetical protein